MKLRKLIATLMLLTGLTFAQTVLPRTGVTQPAIGQVNWGPIVNNDFAILDALSGVDLQSGASYTVVSGDQAKIVELTNSGAVSVALPQAGTTGFASGWWAIIKVQNATGSATITPTTSTIDGAASLSIATGQGVMVMSDGTNWITAGVAVVQQGAQNINLSSPASFNFGFTNNSAGTANGSLVKQVDQSGSITVTKTAVTDTNNVFGCVQSGQGTSGTAFVATQGFATCLFDNSTVTDGDTLIVSTSVGGTTSDTGVSTPASGVVNVGFAIGSHAACGTPPCGPYSVFLTNPGALSAAAAGTGTLPGMSSATKGQPLENNGTTASWSPVYIDAELMSGADPCVKINTALTFCQNSLTNNGGCEVTDRDNPNATSACSVNPWNGITVTNIVDLGWSTYQASKQWFTPQAPTKIRGVGIPGTAITGTIIQAQSAITSDANWIAHPGLIHLGVDSADTFDSIVEELKIDCNSVTGGVGIYSSNEQERADLIGLSIQGCNQVAINFDANGSTGGTGVTHYTMERLHISLPTTSSDGIYFSNGAPASMHDVTIHGNNTTSGRNGFVVTNANSGLYGPVHCEFLTSDCGVGGSSLGSGTYTSGGTITGTVGQTCTLSSFNNGLVGGQATVALTGTNVIAGGTALVIQYYGASATAAPTTATLGNGTATCSGTATISTTLGGFRGMFVNVNTANAIGNCVLHFGPAAVTKGAEAIATRRNQAGCVIEDDTYSPALITTFAQSDVIGFYEAGGLEVQGIEYFENGSGTNASGTDLHILAGAQTGNAIPPRVTLEGAQYSTTSGTGQATNMPRASFGIVKTGLTSGSTTTVASVPLGAGKAVGGKIQFAVVATDGTNSCITSGEFQYVGENTSGVFVKAVTSVSESATSCTSGDTLSVTVSSTGANPSLVQITPTLVGITPTAFYVTYDAFAWGQTTPTY